MEIVSTIFHLVVFFFFKGVLHIYIFCANHFFKRRFLILFISVDLELLLILCSFRNYFLKLPYSYQKSHLPLLIQNQSIKQSFGLIEVGPVFRA